MRAWQLRPTSQSVITFFLYCIIGGAIWLIWIIAWLVCCLELIRAYCRCSFLLLLYVWMFHNLFLYPCRYLYFLLLLIVETLDFLVSVENLGFLLIVDILSLSCRMWNLIFPLQIVETYTPSVNSRNYTPSVSCRTYVPSANCRTYIPSVSCWGRKFMSWVV